MSLAVVNTPGSTVVSGTSAAVERWVRRLGEEGVFCRRVQCGLRIAQRRDGSDSAGVGTVLSDLSPQAGQVPMVSTVTGARCEGSRWTARILVPEPAADGASGPACSRS